MTTNDALLPPMKKFPDGFLSVKNIDHDSEIFRYIAQLHDVLWRFCQLHSPGASGLLDDQINRILPQAEKDAAQEARQGWRTIDSAPKDKSLLLGYFNPLGKWRTVRGHWFEDDYLVNHYEEHIEGGAGWYETVENSDEIPNVWPIDPTHWMPLPPAPALAEREGEDD